VHFKLRAQLFASLEALLGTGSLVSSDQFVYWDPTDPGQRLAPDIGIRVGTPRSLIKSWKTWELGAPHVGVEITSASDESPRELEKKLERYRRAGILEVVRFDPEDAERPLRIWDLLEGDLVERDLAGPEALLCDALGLYWCVRLDPALGPALRLARDPAGTSLIPTAEERIAELEAELEKRR
jgi:Uma2 family endonuclease